MIELTPEQSLALAYGRRRLRDPFSLLLAFDRNLGRAMPHDGPDIVGQIRLAWWREQVGSPARAAAASPLIEGLQSLIETHSIARGDLVALVDGWEILLGNSDLSREGLCAFAMARGGGIFRLAAHISGVSPNDEMVRAGMLWALSDFARHCSDRQLADRTFILARDYLGTAPLLPRALRPFALLAHFAERDAICGLDRLPPAGSPRRIVQAWKFMLGFS